jgi:hypothetical protein
LLGCLTDPELADHRSQEAGGDHFAADEGPEEDRADEGFDEQIDVGADDSMDWAFRQWADGSPADAPCPDDVLQLRAEERASTPPCRVDCSPLRCYV